MKTPNRINPLRKTVLLLLAAVGFVHAAAAQDRIVCYTKIVSTLVSKRGEITASTNRHVMTMNPDGTDPRQLTTGTEDATLPAWRPGKRHILFHRGGTLYVMDANGAGTFAVAAARAGNAADWSPDGMSICYVSSRPDGFGTGLWIVNVDPDARGKNKVGTPVCVREGDCYAPVWSKDGTRIAFSDQNTGLLPQGPRIRILDLATGAVSTLPDVIGLLPSWAPDDQHIAFCGGLASSDMHLWIVNADLSGATQMTDYDKPLLWPTWSPLGDELAFRLGTGQGWDAAIYKLTLATGELTLLREATDRPDWKP